MCCNAFTYFSLWRPLSKITVVTCTKFSSIGLRLVLNSTFNSQAKFRHYFISYVVLRRAQIRSIKRLTLVVVLPEGVSLSEPESELLSNTQKWIVLEDIHTDKGKKKKKTLSEKSSWTFVQEQQGKRTLENCFATWLTVSDFLVMI